MNTEGLFNFMIGFVIGIMTMAFYTTWLRDRGRNECNINLPRSEECIKVWVPPSKELK